MEKNRPFKDAQAFAKYTNPIERAMLRASSREIISGRDCVRDLYLMPGRFEVVWFETLERNV